MKKRIWSLLLAVIMVFGVGAPIITSNPLEASAASIETGEWVGAWGSGMTSITLEDYKNIQAFAGNCTARIIIKPTTGGTKIRFKLSNKYGETSIKINRMTIARVTEGYQVDKNSITQVTHGGGQKWDMVIPAGEEAYTDSINFKVKANETLALSVYLNDFQNITTCGLSGGETYLKLGDNYTWEPDLNDYWGPITNRPIKLSYGLVNVVPLLSNIDVYSEAVDPYSVVIIGDSTVSNNIPEYLSRLIEAEDCDNVGIIGKGIIGNSLLTDGGGVIGKIYGEALLKRMWDDVINQTNVRYAVIKIGANDIIHPKSKNIANYGNYVQPTAEELIKGFQTFIKRCHENDIKVVACSITQWKGTTRNYFGEDDEPQYTWDKADWEIAKKVNKWLKTTKELDGYVDWTTMSGSSSDPDKFKASWTEDYIHPNETAQQEWATEFPLEYIGVKRSPSKISITSNSISLSKGKTRTLKYTITPSGAQNAQVTWSSSNTAVASVDKNGKVTAKGNGTATITCETYNGKKSTCKVKVTTPSTSISLSSTSLKMYTTQTKTLKATVKPTTASNKNVTWSSSNPNVAKVDSNGKITAVAKGSAVITCKAKDGASSATCKVTVTKKINVNGISLNKSSKTIYKGNTYQLTATVSPSNASNKKVTWKSDNTSVASVDSSGKVTAKKNGTAIIMATTADGKMIATCKVTVKTKVTGVSVKSTAKTYIGKSVTLTATVSPSTATNKEVTWKSSDKSVATVNSKGVVTGKKSGTVTITCTTSDGSFKDTCKVTVTKYIKAKGVELNKSSKTLNVRDTYQLTATVSPSNASNKKVTWKSSDTSVVTVNSKGVVTAKKAGTATITCTTSDGSYKDSCKIKVKTVAVKSVKLNEKEIRIVVGDYEKLSATVSPSNATNKSVTWTSSNPDIAKVSSSGKVTAVSKGTVTITCKTKDGSYKATCKVKVYGEPADPDQKVLGVKLNKTAVTIKKGSSYTLIATVLPLNAGNQKVTWSSSDTSVATVNSNGKVTAKKTGKATISVKTADGGWRATCVVTVN